MDNKVYAGNKDDLSMPSSSYAPLVKIRDEKVKEKNDNIEEIHFVKRGKVWVDGRK